MGMNTTFGFHTRLLLCPNCAAPMEVSPLGGATQCAYCGYQSHVVARRQTPIRPAGHPPLDEGERLRRLRAQDGKALAIPPTIQGLMEGGELAAWKVDEAVRIWNTTRQELTQGRDSFQAAESFLLLTILLAQHYGRQEDQARVRGMYESALEVFTLPRHQQVMRGFLARAAVREGDLSAAEEWLAPCDPASDDLETDSAYRISRALIDTAKKNFASVLVTLGPTHGAVPIMDAMDPLAAVLRANALERLGRMPEAVASLREAAQSEGPTGAKLLEQVITHNAPLELCPRSMGLARGRSHGSRALGSSGGSGGVAGGGVANNSPEPRGGAKGAILLGLAYAFTLPVLVLFAFVVSRVFSGAPLKNLVGLLVALGISALIAVGLTFFSILARTSASGAHVLFDTWFPLMMAAVPVGGPFIALLSAYKLLRGKLGAATITVTSGGSRSRTHYDALKLHGSGIPGGIVLLTLALIQPVIFLLPRLATLDTDIPGLRALSKAASEAVGEIRWDGKGTLRCRGRERYLVQDVTVRGSRSMLIRAGDHCVVRIVGSTIVSDGYAALRLDDDAKMILENTNVKGRNSAIRVGERATLIATGGKIETSSPHGIALRTLSHSKATLTDVTLVGGTALRSDDHTEISVMKGTLLGTTAIRVGDSAVVALKDTKVVGKIRRYHKGTVVRLKEGQDLKSIVARRQAIASRVARYEKQACAGFFQCYVDHHYQGPVRVRVVMVIGEKGKVKRSKARVGRVPRKVKRCLRRVAKTKVLANFDGPTGKLLCSYSGNVMGATRMLNISTKYVPDPKSSIHAEKR